MALKDWKKQRKKQSTKRFEIWHNNKKYVAVFYDKYKSVSDKPQWQFEAGIIDNEWGYDRLKINMFKTKSQALAFAKSYMRSH